MENLQPDNINNSRPLSKMNPIAFVLLVLVVTFITYQVFGAVLTLLFVGTDLNAISEKINTTRVILTFSQFAFLLFPVLFLNYLRDKDIKKTFRIKKPLYSVFILGIVGIIVVQPFLQVFLYIQNKMIFAIPFAGDLLQKIKELSDSLEQTTLQLVTAHSIPEFVFIVFVIAVTPAICEEFLFRGLILKNVEKAFKPLNAIILTGVLFAVFHFNPFNLIPLIVLGFYLTFVTYYSESIFASIACHFLNNFISATSVYIFGKESISEPSISGLELLNFIFLGLISLSFFIIVLLAIKKINDSKISTEAQNV
jgi:membrane protease YdiL (CAAX protease family)